MHVEKDVQMYILNMFMHFMILKLFKKFVLNLEWVVKLACVWSLNKFAWKGYDFRIHKLQMMLLDLFVFIAPHMLKFVFFFFFCKCSSRFLLHSPFFSFSTLFSFLFAKQIQVKFEIVYCNSYEFGIAYCNSSILIEVFLTIYECLTKISIPRHNQ